MSLHRSISRPRFEDVVTTALSEKRVSSSSRIVLLLNGKAIYMCTPNGRFRTNVKLCLSMSDFHPETWNPVWSVSAVLTGLLSFMVGTEDTFGSIGTSEFEKIKMAKVWPIK
uniref:UBC core domain-containing protein n=1 Tax=Rhodosorus marinus TaxID=101924 RepID=A0A7S2Z9Y2_9RHOD|mmetsp:Transcript_10844/g.45141  ORF Transcript_10844/g.45141 Transcript_10844/m.45141 type:complete len:112 (+) Transcript_10844:660-995(+)